MRVKICGVTSVDDALLAVDAGVDAIGLVMEPSSPRHVNRELALKIAARVHPWVSIVAVYGRYDGGLPDFACALQIALGDAPTGRTHRVIRAVRPAQGDDAQSMVGALGSASAILVDALSPTALGGTGELANWSAAADLVRISPVPVLLAGGLTPENVGRAISAVRPSGVDACSGTELMPGRKDPQKVRAFVRAARSALDTG